MESNLADELVCSICLSPFQEPQMLRCGHNFCLSCLHSCFRGGRNKSKCPHCRRPFSRKHFTCNRVLGNLAHKLQLNQEPPQTACEAVGICKEHNEPLKLCCKQDLVPICEFCRDLPQHQGHNFLPIISTEKYTKIQEIMTFISKEFEVFQQILNKKEQDLKKTVETMNAENVQQMQDALHSLKEGGEESSQTEMKTKIKNAFENAKCIDSLRGFKQLIERVKEFQIWQPQNNGASVRDEEDVGVNESHILSPQDDDGGAYDDDGSVSDDDDSDENESNEDQAASDDEDNDAVDVNMDQPENWEDEEVAGGGDEQVIQLVNPGGFQIAIGEEENFGGVINITSGSYVSIIHNGSWRWGNNLRRTRRGDQRVGEGLGINRNQGFNVEINRRGRRWRWDHFRRRWQQF